MQGQRISRFELAIKQIQDSLLPVVNLPKQRLVTINIRFEACRESEEYKKLSFV